MTRPSVAVSGVTCQEGREQACNLNGLITCSSLGFSGAGHGVGPVSGGRSERGPLPGCGSALGTIKQLCQLPKGDESFEQGERAFLSRGLEGFAYVPPSPHDGR